MINFRKCYIEEFEMLTNCNQLVLATIVVVLAVIWFFVQYNFSDLPKKNYVKKKKKENTILTHDFFPTNNEIMK